MSWEVRYAERPVIAVDVTSSDGVLVLTAERASEGFVTLTSTRRTSGFSQTATVRTDDLRQWCAHALAMLGEQP